MNILELALTKIEVGFSKIIDSIRNWQRDKRKRQDLEQIRSKKQIAHIARTFDHKEIAKYYEKEAKIIEDTKED
ncbi:MAG: hypothetical protein AABW80_01725 [Nanoarchaeota archaeon]